MLSQIVLLLTTLVVISQGSFDVSFLPGSSMFPRGRDGIIIVTMGDGTKKAVCVSGFTDVYARKACRAMGYPSKGITVLTKRSKLVGKMEIVGVKCQGSELSLKDCVISTDGKDLRRCKRKLRVAHVLCFGPKPIPKSLIYKAITKCDATEKGNMRLLRVPGKSNLGFIQIRETSSHNFRFVCNKYFNFGLAQARFFCNQLCSNSLNPRPIMYLNPGSLSLENGYFKDMICPEHASSMRDCHNVNESTPCDSGYNVALQCGKETKKQDPVPQILCSNRSMKVEWARDQTFPLNSSLVSLHPNHTKGCLYTRRDTKKFVIIKIPLDYCHPIITDDENTVTFKYTIDRLFGNAGVVQFKTKESIDVFCVIPKLYKITKDYVHGEITYPPVKDDSRLKVVMTLHTGYDFQQLLPAPYNIEFYTPIYVKASIATPLNHIKLSLTNCFVTSADNYSGITALNSAKIIDDNCPVEKYEVQIVPLSQSSIGFQFTSFKLLESSKANVNIFCETTKCIVIHDPDCGICKTGLRRSRRSAQLNKAGVIRLGPIILG